MISNGSKVPERIISVDFMFTRHELCLYTAVKHLNGTGMNEGICGLYIPREIESKSAALLYSIELATTRTEKGTEVDTRKAKRIFRFIKANVNLPDVKQDTQEEMLSVCTKLLDRLDEARDR